MSDQAALTRRNMARSRVVVMIAFAVNAGLNMVLLGILAQKGGLDLVGQWSFLNAILLLVMLADFGITNALTYRIGRDGLDEAVTGLRSLICGLSFFAVLCVPVGFGAALVSPDWGVALTMAILAAIAELASNWLIAVRMGHHEQYWFNVKTVLRVVLQTAAALFFYDALPGQAPLAFGLALLLARCAELTLAWWLTRSDFSLWGQRASFAQIAGMAKGFGLLSIAQKGLEPLSRLMISAFAGPAALGVFTVALRIPAVIDQSVSEALRALLPGMSRLRSAAERDKARALLCDAVAGQLVMIGAPMLAVAIHSDLLFRVWLGQSSQTLSNTLIALLIGTVFNTFTRPFFWTIQAFGDAAQLAWLTLVRVGLTLLLGGSFLWVYPRVELFAVVFAVSQITSGILTFRLTNNYDGLAHEVLGMLPLTRIIVFLIGVGGLNLILSIVLADLAPLVALIAVVFCNLILAAPYGTYLLRAFRKS